MFDAGKTRMIGLLYGEESMTKLSRFHSIPERTDRIAINIVSVHTCDNETDL